MVNHFFKIVFLLALISNPATAQYYYKDLLSVQQANNEKKLMQQQKIRKVTIHSFEADGSPSEGFRCEKKISRDQKEVETVSMSQGTNPSITMAYYNNNGWITAATDSSDITSASTVYEYDDKGNIRSITSFNHSSDDDFRTALKEVHVFSYNENNKPEKMLRIKNDRDTMQVDFVVDAKGNVTDEIEVAPNGKHYYFYYNDLNQLTDIVRYNPVKKAMRPDIVFEYNSTGRISQMVTVEEGIPGNYYTEKDAANYFTWRYFYNDEGLRIVEKCFNNRGKLQGYVEYEYE